jgi:hypothetical protein
MKHVRLIVSLSIAAVLAYSFTLANKPKKHALIVAIGDYPEEYHWTDLGSVEDIPLVTEAYLQQGFKSKNITVIKNEEATKAGIMSAFEELTKKLEAGDIVAIHFSSHGQMVADDDGDEMDGFDEAIVCYDAQMVFSEEYTGQNHLRDDELQFLINEIRAVLGKSGDLLVTMDACHSGTMTRSPERTRGSAKPLMPANYSPEQTKKRDMSIYEASNPFSVDGKELAPYVLISAARSYQPNSEYNGKGSLSTAMNKAFKGLNSDMTYRALFARIHKEMSIMVPNQNPAIEGEKDRQLFGGFVIQQEPFYSLHSLYDATVSVNGGWATGITEGTVIELYPAGTVSTEGKEPVTKGRVSFSDPFQSLATLDKSLDEYQKEELWVFVKTKRFGAEEVSVSAAGVESKKCRKALEELIQKSDYCSHKDKDAKYEISGENDRYSVRHVPTDDTLSTQETCSTFVQMENAIKAHVQAAFLKNLDLNNSKFKVSLELIPVKMVSKSPRVYDTLQASAFLDEGGIVTYSSGDRAVIRITNNSDENLYYSLVDINAQNSVLVFLPRKGHNPEDYKILARSHKDVANIKMPKITGKEHFVLFVSRKPLRLSMIANDGGATRSADLNSQMERVFQSSYNRTRNIEDDVDMESDAAVIHFPFNINP